MQSLKKRYRYSVILLKQLVKTDFKLRYQGSVLGYVWTLLRPLLLFLTLYIVFTVFLPFGKTVPHYPVYLFTGIVLWNFFAEVTNGSVDVIVGKRELLRKIDFPRYVILYAVALSALINLALNSIIVLIFMYASGISLSWQALWVAPLIVELFAAAMTLAFLLSALYVKFRDISYIWEVIMQAAFYATPIIYALQRVPVQYQKLIILNPMAQIIQDARHVLVTPYALTVRDIYGGDSLIWLIPVGLVVLAGIVGGWYFKRRSKYFAEEA